MAYSFLFGREHALIISTGIDIWISTHNGIMFTPFRMTV